MIWNDEQIRKAINDIFVRIYDGKENLGVNFTEDVTYLYSHDLNEIAVFPRDISDIIHLGKYSNIRFLLWDFHMGKLKQRI